MASLCVNSDHVINQRIVAFGAHCPWNWQSWNNYNGWKLVRLFSNFSCMPLALSFKHSHLVTHIYRFVWFMTAVGGPKNDFDRATMARIFDTSPLECSCGTWFQSKEVIDIDSFIANNHDEELTVIPFDCGCSGTLNVSGRHGMTSLNSRLRWWLMNATKIANHGSVGSWWRLACHKLSAEK